VAYDSSTAEDLSMAGVNSALLRDKTGFGAKLGGLSRIY
jgi:hypothetical protein